MPHTPFLQHLRAAASSPRRTALRLGAGAGAVLLAASSLAFTVPEAHSLQEADSTPGTHSLPADPQAAAAPGTNDEQEETTAEETAAAESDPERTDVGADQDAADADEVQVRISSVTPWLDTDDTLTVSGRIVNGTAEYVHPGSLTLSRSGQRLTSRDTVASWASGQGGTSSAILLAAAGEEEAAGTPENTGPEGPDDSDTEATGPGEGSGSSADDAPQRQVPELPEPLDPGASADFTFQLPASDLGISGSAIDSWGARGLVVSLSAQSTPASGELPPSDVSAALTASAPAFTVWYPDPGVDPTVISTVLPVTLDSIPADGGPLIEPEILERAADPTAQGAYAGSLDRVLASAENLPSAALAVDPRVLASARAALELPEEGTDTGSGAEEDPDVPSPAASPDDSGAGNGGPDEHSQGLGSHAPGASAWDVLAQSIRAQGASPSPSAPAAESTDDSTADVPEEDPADPDTPQEGADPEAAAERLPRLAVWYSEFTDLAADREIIQLAWGDADTGLLRSEAASDAASEDAASHAAVEDAGAADDSGHTHGSGDLLDQAETPTSLGADLGEAVDTGTAWPAAGTVRPSDLRALARAGTDTVLLSDEQHASVTGYTSSAHSTMTTDGALGQPGSPGSAANPDENPVEGTEEDSSDEEGPAGAPASLTTFTADSGLSSAAADQAGGHPRAPGELLAQTAAITGERPFDSRHLLLTLPRDAGGAGLTALSEHLDDAPWLGAETLDTLAATEPVARGELQEPDTGEDGADSDAAQLARGLGESYGAGSSAASIFTEDEEVRRDMARALLPCASVSRIATLRPASDTDSGAAGGAEGGDTAPEAGPCAQRTGSWVSDLAGGVQTEPGSSVLLVTGEQAMIPLHVVNSTDRSAVVRLRVHSPTAQLSTEDSEPLELGPEESRSMEVPVRGLANADVEAQVRIIGSDGTVLPGSTELLVRVRADWENTATIAVGSALVVVLVFGLFKTIRRGRRKIPKNQLDAAVARAQDR